MGLQATTTYPAIVGRVIAEARKHQKLTQGQLAQEMGINQPAWSKIERGQTAMTIEQLAEVAPLLGYSPSQLLKQADLAAQHAENEGVQVESRRVGSGEPAAVALIGAAALGALIAAILSRS